MYMYITSSQWCTLNILHFCQLYLSKAEIKKKKESILGECIIYFNKLVLWIFMENHEMEKIIHMQYLGRRAEICE